jgi:hypothetical protein
MTNRIELDCIYQVGLPHIAPIECSLDRQIYDREHCLNCKDRIKPKEKEINV